MAKKGSASEFEELTQLLTDEAARHGCRIIVTTRRDDTMHIELWKPDEPWHPIEIDWMRGFFDMTVSEALAVTRQRLKS